MYMYIHTHKYSYAQSENQKKHLISGLSRVGTEILQIFVCLFILWTRKVHKTHQSLIFSTREARYFRY